MPEELHTGRLGPQTVTNRTYLGDGAYVQYNDNGDVLVTAENGVYATDVVVLDAAAAELLRRWLMKGSARG